MTLTEFLLARVAEDESAARACAEVYPSPWDVSDRGHSATVRADEPNFAIVAELDQERTLDGVWCGEYLEHIARHDPARVLADCEAKRRIVELARFSDSPESAVDFWLSEGKGRRAPAAVAVLIDVLRALALPFADHPDWREEWRP